MLLGITPCQPTIATMFLLRTTMTALLAAVFPLPALAETFSEAIAAAWDRLPERNNIDAADNVANARVREGDALFPNAPHVDGEYDDDRLGSNDDHRTTGVELGTPVWLPGEGTATVGVGTAQGDAAAAERDAMHLAVARRVLSLALAASLAVDERAVARSRLVVDRLVATALRERYRVGENSQSDALAADAAEAASDAALIDADAAAGEAIVELTAATGSETVPVLEQGAPNVDLTDALLALHPNVVAATLEVREAEAEGRLVRIADRDDPELGLQVTNDKQPCSP